MSGIFSKPSPPPPPPPPPVPTLADPAVEDARKRAQRAARNARRRAERLPEFCGCCATKATCPLIEPCIGPCDPDLFGARKGLFCWPWPCNVSAPRSTCGTSQNPVPMLRREFHLR